MILSEETLRAYELATATKHLTTPTGAQLLTGKCSEVDEESGTLLTYTFKAGKCTRLRVKGPAIGPEGQCEPNMAIELKDGLRHGTVTWFHTEQDFDKVIWQKSYVAGELDGLVTKWYIQPRFKAGAKLQYRAIYKHGKLDGPAERFYRSGKTLYKCSYTAGKLNGLFETFRADGHLNFTGFYYNGLKGGGHLTYFASGQLKSEDYYNQDLAAGTSYRILTSRVYYKDGTLHFEKHYNHQGKLDGMWTKYNRAGDIIEQHLYKNEDVLVN